MDPRVSLITINWNGIEDTLELLESIKKMNYQNIDVVVVDNGSEGRDVTILKERYGDSIHLVENDRNYGFAEGANRGLRYALDNLNPNYLVVLDNDTTVEPEFLDDPVKLAEERPEIGFIGGKIRIPGSDDVWTGCSYRKWWRIGTPRIDPNSPVTEVDVAAGCRQFMTRKVLDTVGLYDPTYSASFDNIEICLRAKKAGFRIFYVPTSVVWHKHSKSRARLLADPRYYQVVRQNAKEGLRARIRILREYSHPLNRPTQFIILFGYILPQSIISSILIPANPLTLRIFLGIFFYHPIVKLLKSLISRVTH